MRGILCVLSHPKYIWKWDLSFRVIQIKTLSLWSLLWHLLSQEDNKPEDDSVSKRRRKGNHYLTEVGSTGRPTCSCSSKVPLCSVVLFDHTLLLPGHQLSCHSAPPAGEDGEPRENKVRFMATQLLAKFEENSSTAKMRSKVRGGPCYRGNILVLFFKNGHSAVRPSLHEHERFFSSSWEILAHQSVLTGFIMEVNKGLKMRLYLLLISTVCL